MRLGRMSERSAAIGLASASSWAPPPNSSAAGFEMNDQVTASTMPRAASARFVAALERRHRHLFDADNADDLFDDIGLAMNIRAPGGHRDLHDRAVARH